MGNMYNFEMMENEEIVIDEKNIFKTKEDIFELLREWIICDLSEKISIRLEKTVDKIVSIWMQENYLNRLASFEFEDEEKGVSTERLNQTIKICRPCHTCLHRLYDNETLASTYSEIDQIMEDEKVLKFVKYVRSQPCRSLNDGKKQLKYKR